MVNPVKREFCISVVKEKKRERSKLKWRNKTEKGN